MLNKKSNVRPQKVHEQTNKYFHLINSLELILKKTKQKQPPSQQKTATVSWLHM